MVILEYDKLISSNPCCGRFDKFEIFLQLARLSFFMLGHLSTNSFNPCSLIVDPDKSISSIFLSCSGDTLINLKYSYN